jgi:hypothetical protein
MRDEKDRCPLPPAATQADRGYIDAFYKVAELLGVGARPNPPKVVFETVILPRLRDLLQRAAPTKSAKVCPACCGANVACRWCNGTRVETRESGKYSDYPPPPETGAPHKQCTFMTCNEQQRCVRPEICPVRGALSEEASR